MLVVCALALVAAAAAYLVMGLVDGAVGDLYLSMALCAASLVVLAVSARVSRPRPERVSSEPPAATEPEGAPAPEPEPVRRRELVGAAAATRRTRVASAPPEVEPAGAPDRQPEVEVPAPAAPVVAVDDEPSIWAPPPGADPFPIADYDALETEQVLPLIGRLWPEEIPVVVARERATKARPAVLDALAAEAGDPALAFPIAEYATLDTEQITKLLARLDEADLEVVRSAERSGDARVGVLVAVANQLAARR